MSFSNSRETQIAFLHPTSVITSQTSTSTSSTEGTDKLTVTLQHGGLYRCNIYAVNVTVSNAETSHLLDGRLSFTDETGAKSAVGIERGVSQASFNHKSAGATISWSGLFRGIANSTVSVAMLNTVSSSTAVTPGQYRWCVSIDRIGK